MSEHDKDSGGGEEQGVSRRTFMQSVIAASAAAGTVGLPAPAGAAAPGAAATPTTVMTGEQSRALTLVLDRLIPKATGLPGAGEAGVAAFVDRAMAAGPHLRRHVLGVLAGLPDLETLAAMPPDAVDDRLAAVEQAMPDSFDVLLQAVYTGYYSLPQVVASLGVQSDAEGHLLLDRFALADLDAIEAARTGRADA